MSEKEKNGIYLRWIDWKMESDDNLINESGITMFGCEYFITYDE